MSILIRPRSSTSSLSNWTTMRPSMVAGSTGTMSTSGSPVTSIPPTWMERWRGKPWISWQSLMNCSQVWEPITSFGSSKPIESSLQALGHCRRDRVVPLARALLGQPVEVAEGSLAFGDREAGEADAAEVEVEVALLGQLRGQLERLGVVAEERLEPAAVLQVALGVGVQLVPHLVQRGLVLDGDQHVVQRPALGVVVADLVAGDQQRLVPAGHLGAPGHHPSVLGSQVVDQLDEDAVPAESVLQLLQAPLGVGVGEEEEILVVLHDGGQVGSRLA